jgi:nucleobase:cation symporter-1, NCS1 family
VAFAAMVPFMNTSVVEGPVAAALHGADIAFYVGFIVAGLVYYGLQRLSLGQPSAFRERTRAAAAEQGLPPDQSGKRD